MLQHWFFPVKFSRSYNVGSARGGVSHGPQDWSARSLPVALKFVRLGGDSGTLWEGWRLWIYTPRHAPSFSLEIDRRPLLPPPDLWHYEQRIRDLESALGQCRAMFEGYRVKHLKTHPGKKFPDFERAKIAERNVQYCDYWLRRRVKA